MLVLLFCLFITITLNLLASSTRNVRVAGHLLLLFMFCLFVLSCLKQARVLHANIKQKNLKKEEKAQQRPFFLQRLKKAHHKALQKVVKNCPEDYQRSVTVHCEHLPQEMLEQGQWHHQGRHPPEACMHFSHSFHLAGITEASSLSRQQAQEEALNHAPTASLHSSCVLSTSYARLLLPYGPLHCCPVYITCQNIF